VERNVKKWCEKCNERQVLMMGVNVSQWRKAKKGRAIILADKMSVTIEEIAFKVGISEGTANSLVHDILVFRRFL
jgi:hypothetical protein